MVRITSILSFSETETMFETVPETETFLLKNTGQWERSLVFSYIRRPISLEHFGHLSDILEVLNKK